MLPDRLYHCPIINSLLYMVWFPYKSYYSDIWYEEMGAKKYHLSFSRPLMTTNYQ